MAGDKSAPEKEHLPARTQKRHVARSFHNDFSYIPAHRLFAGK
jgi:hypothetical protein